MRLLLLLLRLHLTYSHRDSYISNPLWWCKEAKFENSVIVQILTNQTVLWFRKVVIHCPSLLVTLHINHDAITCHLLPPLKCSKQMFFLAFVCWLLSIIPLIYFLLHSLRYMFFPFLCYNLHLWVSIPVGYIAIWFGFSERHCAEKLQP